jgi:hypothetical protein
MEESMSETETQGARRPEMIEMMRGLFDGSGAMRERMSSQIAGLAEAQQLMLREMEDMAHGWFSRRHSGTQAALEAAREMTASGDPAEAVNAYQRWIAGSFGRVAADAMEVQSHGARMMKLAADALAVGVRAPEAGHDGHAARRGAAAATHRPSRRAAG